MTSVKQDLTIYAGDTVTISVGITDSGAAASLSSASAAWILETSVGSGSIIRKATGGSGISLSGSVATISVCPADTLSLAGDYYHELEVTDAYGNISTTTIGTITIRKSGASL